jgi:hypothetical protein
MLNGCSQLTESGGLEDALENGRVGSHLLLQRVSGRDGSQPRGGNRNPVVLAPVVIPAIPVWEKQHEIDGREIGPFLETDLQPVFAALGCEGTVDRASRTRLASLRPGGWRRQASRSLAMVS